MSDSVLKKRYSSLERLESNANRLARPLDSPNSPPTPPIAFNSPGMVLGSPMQGHEDDHSPTTSDAWSGPRLPQPATTSQPFLTARTMEVYINAYFEYFHPSFPLLHRPTVGEDAPEILRNIIIAIGSLYTAQTYSEQEAAACVDSNYRTLRTTWAIQAWLLHIIYGAFMGDAARYDTSKKMLRLLVDAAQDFGSLRQSVATSSSRSWTRGYDKSVFGGDEQMLESQWMLYVEEESMKLCMYTLLFLDFHILSPCNIRPLTSPLELDWELPLAASL
ncbi:hypothetical protein G7046_g4974 [Stylonectria norvegica]|nr:hypothetical protein G7046_g4974 [Stylonectria norvegica]